MSAIFSPIMIALRLVLALGMVGMIDASAIRKIVAGLATNSDNSPVTDGEQVGRSRLR